MKYHQASESNTVLIYTATCMDLQKIMLEQKKKNQSNKVWLPSQGFLEMTKLLKWRSDQWLSGIKGRAEDSRTWRRM